MYIICIKDLISINDAKFHSITSTVNLFYPSDSNSNFFFKIISHKIALLNLIQIIFIPLFNPWLLLIPNNMYIICTNEIKKKR